MAWGHAEFILFTLKLILLRLITTEAWRAVRTWIWRPSGYSTCRIVSEFAKFLKLKQKM